MAPATGTELGPRSSDSYRALHSSPSPVATPMGSPVATDAPSVPEIRKEELGENSVSTFRRPVTGENGGGSAAESSTAERNGLETYQT